jgi:uncharacterized protein (DUF1697 family)
MKGASLARYIAFLRAINVGGHTAKMEHLRQLFESFGFSHVETFIASGNVVFETTTKSIPSLETKIASGLRDALGYEAAAFIRTETELAAIAGYRPFPQAALDAATAFNVAFLAEPPDKSIQQKVAAMQTAIDDFKIHGREVYWLCRKKQSESTFSNAVLEKTLKVPSTLRGMSTIKKMATKFSL